jgi:hypothetical protein
MTRGNFLLWNKLHIVLRGFVMVVIITGLVGCASSTATPPIVCTPESPNVNIYRTTPQTTRVSEIFQHAYQPTPTPSPLDATIPTPSIPISEMQILGARFEALNFLKNQTIRWSDAETIKLDNLNEVQITVTFISPELIQAVFLNEVLKDRIITSDFEAQLQGVLNYLANRDELLFLVTVTATTNNNSSEIPHTLEIPIEQMLLNNASNLKSSPYHDDHNLEQPIDTTTKPVFGYIAYPLAVFNTNDCNWILDPKYNTNIVITTPDIKLDHAVTHPYTWTIPYKPLIEINNNSDMNTTTSVTGLDPNLLVPSAMPPNPKINQNDPNKEAYWQDFARYVWNQVTLGNY